MPKPNGSGSSLACSMVDRRNIETMKDCLGGEHSYRSPCSSAGGTSGCYRFTGAKTTKDKISTKGPGSGDAVAHSILLFLGGGSEGLKNEFSGRSNRSLKGSR
jgi:hypothetical protein